MILRVENILILGAYGRLGEDLSLFLGRYHKVFRHGRNNNAQVYIPELSVCSLTEVLSEHKITVIVNLVAMTDVNKCESAAMHAFFANALIPHYVRNAVDSFDKDIFVLQLSTDQLYSGNGMLAEECVKPINVYGISKLSGEYLINSSVNTCILRTNYFGLSAVTNRSSFLDWIVDSIQESKRISIYKNVFFTPVGSTTLCSVIAMIIENKTTGTYNLGSNKRISKADFAWAVANVMQIPNPKFTPVDYPTNALVKRPDNMSMNSEKLLNTLSIDPVLIEHEIKRELESLIT